MYKYILSSTVFLLVAHVSITADVAHAEDLYIKVRRTQLRSEPVVWSPSITTVNYGDKVNLLKEDSNWMFVAKGGSQGYLHESAVNDDPVGVKSASIMPDMGSSDDGVSLAAKGFDSNVESSYRKDNPQLRFDRLRQMEKRAVNHTALVQFMKQGKLIQ